MSLNGIPVTRALEASEDISLDDIADLKLRENVSTLKAMCPHHPLIDIQNTLIALNGSIYQAIDNLTGGQGSSYARSGLGPQYSAAGPSSNENNKNSKSPDSNTDSDAEESDISELNHIVYPDQRLRLRQLKAIYPFHTLSELFRAAENAKWDANLAAERLSSKPSSSIGTEDKTNHAAASKRALSKAQSTSSTSKLLATSQSSPRVGVTHQNGVIASFRIDTRTPKQDAMAKTKTGNKMQGIGKDEIKSTPAGTKSSSIIDLTGEPETERSEEEKIDHLFDMFPHTTRDKCAAELKKRGGHMGKAYHALVADVGHSYLDCTKSSGDDDDDDEAEDEDNGNEDEDYLAGFGEQCRKIIDKGKGKAVEPGPKKERSLKRGAGNEGKPAAKRVRVSTDDEEELNILESSEQWVLENYEDSGGLSIKLDSGLHPCKFPVPLLQGFGFFQGVINPSAQEDNEEEVPTQTIEVPHVTRENWDLAVQWSIMKNITLDPSRYATREQQITVIIELIFTAVQLGSPALETGLVGILRSTIIAQRSAVKGHHIRRAFQLPRDHQIRHLFVQAAFRLFFVHRPPHYSRDQGNYVGAQEELDQAHRAAFNGGVQYKYQAELDTIPDFELALLREMRTVMLSREVRGSRSGLTSKVYYIDPLTEEIFKLCDCN